MTKLGGVFILMGKFQAAIYKYWNDLVKEFLGPEISGFGMKLSAQTARWADRPVFLWSISFYSSIA